MKTSALLLSALLPFYLAGAVVIPSGADIEINAENLAEYSGGISFEDETGIVRLNLPQAPAFAVSGAGTLIKTSAADWTMTTAIPEFTGDYVLGGSGTVSAGIAQAFGSAGNNSYAHSLTVQSGSTLSVTANVKDLLGYRVLVLNGTGSGGRGALEITAAVSSNEAIGHIRLGSDARMTITGGKYLFLAATGKGLDLNGHELELAGKGYLYNYSKLSGEGKVVLKGDEGGYVDFVARDVYFAAEPSETSPIVLANRARLNFYNAAKRIERPLWVSGTDNAVFHSEQWPDRHPDYAWKTNIVAVGGDVVFTDETAASALRVYNSFPRRLLTLAGDIKGHGSVKVTGNLGGVRFEGSESDFDGGLYVNGKDGGQFQAMCPGSVGAYGSVTGDWGHIDADFSVEEGDGRWTAEDFADFARSAVWLNGAFPLLDARAAAEPPVLDAADFEDVAAWGVAGDSVVTNADDLAAGFIWQAGRVKLVSGRVLDWTGGFSVAGAAICTNSVSGQVMLDGGVKVETGETPVRIGGMGTAAFAGPPRLVIRRATLVNRDASNGVFTSATNSALVVGGCLSGAGSGVLELHEGAVVTNKLLVGGWEGTIDLLKGTGSGGVRQFGGSMTAVGTSASHHLGGHLGSDAGSYGGYEMHGGDFTALGSFQIGYYGTGVWSQYGGRSVFTNEIGGTAARYHDIGGGNYGRGTMYVAGGRVDSFGTVAINSSAHPSLEGFGHLAVDGEGAVYDAHSTSVTMNQSAGGKGGAFLEINRGGVFRALSICAYNGATRESYVGFNGGTYEISSDANPKDFFYSPSYRPTRVTVYPLGARFDTAGFGGIRIRTDLEGTCGGGVTAVPLASPLTHARMVASPLVRIEGDGCGASAVAGFDPSTGAVTNVLVTANGWDYSVATAKLMIAGTTIASLPCTVGTIPNTGSLTKAGAGDLTLYGTNTYGGATVLAGGVLRLGSDGALPAGTTIELAGGTIDAGEFAATLPKIWEIDAAAAYAAGGIDYDGDLEFPAGSQLRIRNLSAVPETCERLELLRVSGVLTGSPELVDADDAGRILRLSGKGIRASVPKGLTLIVR